MYRAACLFTAAVPTGMLAAAFFQARKAPESAYPIQPSPFFPEEMFTSTTLSPIDIDEMHPLLVEHYLQPNEALSETLHSHFNPQEGSFHICTGTERLFSNACFAPKREGFIGVDIDSQVIAYNHFNTLLLKLAETHKEYLEMILPPAPRSIVENHNLQLVCKQWGLKRACCQETLKDRISFVRKKLIQNPQISLKWKNYYLTTLETYAKVFYTRPGKYGFFHLLAEKRASLYYGPYHTDPEMFKKLKTYALEGRFVFLQRDINDLRFIETSRVAEVDTSNIWQYVMIAPQFQMQPEGEKKDVRIIYTFAGNQMYSSFSYCPLKQEDEQKFDQLLNLKSGQMKTHLQGTHLPEEQQQVCSGQWYMAKWELSQLNVQDGSPVTAYTKGRLEALASKKAKRQAEAIRQIAEKYV